jgi:hypothetical protein
MSMHDTTPSCAPPSPSRIESAARELPKVLQSRASGGAISLGASIAMDELLDELGRRGHSWEDGVWAVHRLAQAELVEVEADTTIVGYKPDPASTVARLRDYFASHADRPDYQVPVYGAPRLRVRLTPRYWEWFETEGEVPCTIAPAKPRCKRRRGRPSDTDHGRDRRLLEAWKTERYKTHAELAAAFQMSEKAVERAFDRVRKRGNGTS